VAQILPKALTDLIDAFTELPGVGPRTAERYAYWCLKHGTNTSDKIADALTGVHQNVGVCPKTFALINSDQAISPLYESDTRDKQIVAVVAEPLDIVAIENIGNFNGTYHVLGGLVSPIDGISPESLTIKQLVERIKTDNVTEVILALNASVEGESTALYIQRQIDNPEITITKLARGLPIGVDLEYADQITLKRALEGRTKV
jgi:recombination protein RecR